MIITVPETPITIKSESPITIIGIRRFRENDIVEFIKTHPQEINLAKVEPTWFLDLVLLRGRELHSTSPSRPNFDGDAAA